MNLRDMHNEIHEHWRQCQRDAFSPDNLGGCDRYCAGAMRGAYLSLHLAEAVPPPHRLIIELKKLRYQQIRRFQLDERNRNTRFLSGILYSIDQVLFIAQKYAEEPPTMRGHSTTPYADIRSRA
jgi:hypothetical protein